jgi:hypothetical protein
VIDRYFTYNLFISFPDTIFTTAVLYYCSETSQITPPFASLSVLASTMTTAPPEVLTISTLISAKGAQLGFWIIQTNEAAKKKALNITGTVDQLHMNLWV